MFGNVAIGEERIATVTLRNDRHARRRAGVSRCYVILGEAYQPHTNSRAMGNLCITRINIVIHINA